VLLNQGGNRPAARLFGLTSLMLVLLAMGGILNDTLGKFSASSLLVPALLFAVPLAAHASTSAGAACSKSRTDVGGAAHRVHADRRIAVVAGSPAVTSRASRLNSAAADWAGRGTAAHSRNA